MSGRSLSDSYGDYLLGRSLKCHMEIICRVGRFQFHTEKSFGIIISGDR